MITLEGALAACPLIAILRGITPAEAEEIGDVLVETGFRVIEVPLNSPRPMHSIEALAHRYGGTAVIGAGTVTSRTNVKELRDAGGRLVVMPHLDRDVVHAAKDAGMWAVPGVATPTEAFSALASGADALKLFPAEMIGPPVVKSIRAVLPKGVTLIPVGGISAANIASYLAAGAGAFGIGSTLYSPGKAATAVKESALELMAAVKRAQQS